MTDKQQVRAVYASYAKHLREAETLGPAERREFLSQWLAEPALSNRVEGIQTFLQSGRRTSGSVRPDIQRVTVSGKEGRVSDCSDESELVVRDREMKVVRRGVNGVRKVSTLELTPAGWRITEVAVGDKRCV